MSKRILFVVYSLNIGGLERIVVNLANDLDPRRYEPYICCIANAGEFAQDFIHPENLSVIGNTGRINVRSCKFIYDILNAHAIDIVHSHNLAGLLYSFPAVKLRRIPLIHTNHGYLAEERNNSALLYCEKWMSRFVDRYVCVSDHLKSEVQRRLHVKSEKMIVLYNGLTFRDREGSARGEGDGSIVIGSVGSLSPIKNYRLLIEAFAQVLARHAECRLELIGDGSERAELAALCNRLGIGDRVLFRGKVRAPLRYVKDFDLFVLTSLSEGLSMSILEAMAAGKICVVSRVGGNPEIITHGKNGFLFESNNRQDCVRKMLHVIEHGGSEKMERIRAAAQDTIREKFSLDSMRARYCELYDEIGR